MSKCRRCNERISAIDPEIRYCAKHRICVLLKKPKKSEKIHIEEPKLIDYQTFRLSCIDVFSSE